MNGTNASGAPTAPVPQPEVRSAVRDLLLKSPSFSQLTPETQRQIAHDMAQVADYLACPEGIPANKLPSAAAMAGALADPTASTYDRDVAQVNRVGEGFRAAGAREGAAVAGALMKQVNFVEFVSGLIQGVFHAIVTASIEQMEAYGKLVASVAKSLNQFRDENVSENQGRDHLVEQFPDLFEIGDKNDDFFGGGAGPRVKLRDGVDEDAALSKVNSTLPVEGGPLKSLDLDDDETERKLVQASRTQLATSRQQLLATMVLMGINRIVITDGKIQAKILYDFQAKDTFRRQRSAVAADYARDMYGNVQRTYDQDSTWDNSSEGGERRGQAGTDQYEERGGNWYAKGSYKYSQKPIVTAMSTASETSDASLSTKAQLAGVVDVNFKSDYFPLEKMADSFQIGQIQNAAKPANRGAPAIAAGGAPGQSAGTAPQSTVAPTTTTAPK